MENPWQNLFPRFESGEDWQQFINNYNQNLWNQFADFWLLTLKNSLNTADLWQSYIQEMQNLNHLWVNELRTSLESLSKTEVNSPTQIWIELNNLYWNLMYEKTLGNFTEIPLLGPSREFNYKLMRAFDAWANLYPTSIAYQTMLAEIQRQSFEELMGELISLGKKGETVKDWYQFQQLWSYTADQVFEKAFCSEDNLKVRGNFLNAINQYKLCQQELMEIYLKMMDMPTRSEVDEVHKSIYVLQKELKNLKKTLAEQAQG